MDWLCCCVGWVLKCAVEQRDPLLGGFLQRSQSGMVPGQRAPGCRQDGVGQVKGRKESSTWCDGSQCFTLLRLGLRHHKLHG